MVHAPLCAAFVIAKGDPQHHEGSPGVTAHLTSQVAFGDDKSGTQGDECGTYLLTQNLTQTIANGNKIKAQ